MSPYGTSFSSAVEYTGGGYLAQQENEVSLSEKTVPRPSLCKKAY
jgi:hypothetical protein